MYICAKGLQMDGGEMGSPGFHHNVLGQIHSIIAYIQKESNKPLPTSSGSFVVLTKFQQFKCTISPPQLSTLQFSPDYRALRRCVFTFPQNQLNILK